ncbi:unnamed protein product, partial [marine sediment metagenome]
LFVVDSAGDVTELAHGTANKVLTSGGASADPTWEDASAGATLGGIGDVTISAVAEGELIKRNGASTWINQTLAEAGILADTADIVKETHIDWGSGASQIDADDVPDSATRFWASETGADVTADNTPKAHLLGAHTTDTLANLNAIVTDATLDDSSATRTPGANSVGNSQIDNTAIDIAFANIILTPASTNASETEGAIFYDSDENHLYVYVTA